ncbi:MAG TPA: oligopeptide transporter, OPT family [bacterium]|jgi:putative OPT family oligopeptide transporter|nr:oligopeptide transporter, OPT family [bacterium]HNT66759.1 oligopeptide transporter, OPT family [bacterium]HOX87654.1 oligopeptide transporter, OPT family [bacterium]HPG44956.1 oligopeptide transporter, OPT family [bacterium]HPM99632.1 oligopeptide transporter, OPT family [bacterium]
MTLPENAYRPLKSGEEYKPVVPVDKPLPEITLYSLLWGLFYAAIFSAAAAYLGLKIGQVFEAAIPIAILAVGTSVFVKRKNALSENVIIQSIGAASGVVVAGAIFTIPAIYILKLEASFFQIFLSSLFGGFLGILFLIPFRKYFVDEMHGQFPFPEATATTEVLVAGEAGGEQAWILLKSMLIGGIYNFFMATFHWWSEVFETRAIPFMRGLADDARLVFRLNVDAAILGLGYIVGLKYAAIIAAGSFVSWFVFVPLVHYFGQHLTVTIGSTATALIANMSAEEIFSVYVRHIGIGGIACAGIIGILKSSGIIGGAMKLAWKEIAGGKALAQQSKNRMQKDLPMGVVAALILISILAILIFFYFGVVHNLWQAVVGLLIVIVISFLFTTVAARAIAIVGTNPVSGMTLMTLIISSVILVKVGLSGSTGMVSALIIGGVVCTALSMAGGFITDLKIGYWLGTTPINQQKYKFLGTLVAAASVGLVIMMLNKTYGFGPDSQLAAPQANAMAAVIQPLMSNQPAPWMLYVIGAIFAVILQMVGISPLAFALGMYIPLELNTPILIGGFVAYLVAKSSRNEETSKKRRERGTLIASGFIAGGAIMGVLSAFLKYVKFDHIAFIRPLITESWAESLGGERVALVLFILLVIYMIWDSKRVKES